MNLIKMIKFIDKTYNKFNSRYVTECVGLNVRIFWKKLQSALRIGIMQPANFLEKFSPTIRLHVRKNIWRDNIEVELQDTGCAVD